MKHFIPFEPKLIVGIFFISGVMQVCGITCPIKSLWGISCPSCGMSRAWWSALHLDFKKAFTFHPLFIFPLLVLLGYWGRHRLSRRMVRWVGGLGLVVVFLVYFWRLFDPTDHVVVFAPQESVFYHLLIGLRNLL